MLMLAASRDSTQTTKKETFKQILRKTMEMASSNQDQSNMMVLGQVRLLLEMLAGFKSLPNYTAILTDTLHRLLGMMQRFPSGSLFEQCSSSSFMVDQTLNQVRDFLIQLLNDQKGEEIVTLTFKLLLTIANATGSIEDLLMTLNQLDRAKVVSLKPNLQSEI